MWKAFGWHFYGKNSLDMDHWYYGWKDVSPVEAVSLVNGGRHLVQLW